MKDNISREEMYELDRLYPEIRKWGKEMCSYDYYIINQQLEAKRDKAPSNATYKKEDGTWATKNK